MRDLCRYVLVYQPVQVRPVPALIVVRVTRPLSLRISGVPARGLEPMFVIRSMM